jgi:hypothetical protein
MGVYYLQTFYMEAKKRAGGNVQLIKLIHGKRLHSKENRAIGDVPTAIN